MRKVSKILLVTAIILLFTIIPQESFAKENLGNLSQQTIASSKAKGPLEKHENPNNFDDISTWNIHMDQTSPIEGIDIVGFIIKILRNLSIILTVLVITVLGIKYMVGSVEQKADYKKAYINIIIGVVLVTMITSIIDVIFSAAQNI